jgi:uncharacterized protein (TIGR03435 family)
MIRVAYHSSRLKHWRWLSAAALVAVIATPAVAQVAAGPTFDVVSVKPNRTGSGSTSVHTDNERYETINLSLKKMIQNAYGLQTPDQISGLPGWANSVNFDIEAKVDAETMARLKAASRDEESKLRRSIMQAMLADRFQLKVHPDTKELPIYELTLAKGGSKLPAADPADTKNGSMNSNNQKLTATGIPLSNLCNYLSERLHRKVVDKTGLAGEYSFTLQWSPDEAAGESVAATGTEQLPSLFTALQEQLGLRLDSAKGPVDTIVVDKVEMPSEN